MPLIKTVLLSLSDMKTYQCQCGQVIFFENYRCEACLAELGYLPDQRELATIEVKEDGCWSALGGRYRKCINYEREQVCNWMVVEHDTHNYCHACRLNYVTPDLSRSNNRQYWYRLEQGKRRLLYSLYALGLPVVGRADDPENGLAFSFLEDAPVFRESGAVVTGHEAGMITINLAEADDVLRETMRNEMNESYRTLLGHFRHESGHYYWSRLIKDSGNLNSFRALFGDERQGYDDALAAYYQQGAVPSWQQNYISAYASAHPWEDWAETWAHYLHLLDTLETAHDFGLVGKGVRKVLVDVYGAKDRFEQLLDDWTGLTVAMNNISRSMGLQDYYPFSISDKVREKFHFVDQLVLAGSR